MREQKNQVKILQKSKIYKNNKKISILELNFFNLDTLK